MNYILIDMDIVDDLNTGLVYKECVVGCFATTQDAVCILDQQCQQLGVQSKGMIGTSKEV